MGTTGLRMTVRRLCGLALLAHGLLGAAALAEPQEPRSLPAARWDGPGIGLTVRIAAGEATVGAEPMNAAAHFAIGIVAMPIVALNPPAALGWPFYMLLAAPWQASFNARADTLARALAAEPLPGAVVDAVRAQWRQPPGDGVQDIDLQIKAYGLATRSGKRLEAFEAGEDLCLQTLGVLVLQRKGTPARDRPLDIGTGTRTPGLPPPTCMSMARWAEGDGRRLRAAVAELAEILAALVLQASEEPP
jgi:hypothetical protein